MPSPMENGERRSECTLMVEQYIAQYHRHQTSANQCTSILIRHIRAPVHMVWSLVRRFDQPHRYKPFICGCVVSGGLRIGTLRVVNVVTGLPATTSTERLELLDDQEHILRIKIIGGDHRLRNYSSIVTVHSEVVGGRLGTVVLESFVVDVPEGNTEEETCFFVEVFIKFNLAGLADITERMAVRERTAPRNHV
ncbi:hypothetical protein SAY87_010973 [Trapa incisa]|uniref:Uncharacterized protein n=1 Tax=Trapa incisa TaxID=236973 RepID=A0AAN7GIL7_9MYRT|nr:hypothetical protein SAY87_010973 [Trapa incisa]